MRDEECWGRMKDRGDLNGETDFGGWKISGR